MLSAALTTGGLLAQQSPRVPRHDQNRPLVRAQQAAEVAPSRLGDPIAGIGAAEFERFRLGLEDFLEVEDSEEGLGPVFNGRSCAECHAVPRIGGSGTIMEPRAGIRRPDGRFEEMAGGTLFPLFSIPTHSVQAVIPSQANVVAFRKSLPLFGGGLVEAVPDEDLIALEDPDDLNGDGISGRAARVLDRAVGKVLAGRFGWKAQQARLITFTAEAYRDEMGITNDLFRGEFCPYGVDCGLLATIDPAPDPEDGPDPLTGLRGIDNFESFLRFLGPPPRGPLTAQAEEGGRIFREIRCSACHVPTLTSGPSDTPALRNKRFHPYGDFLLHDVGTGDGIAQADAEPEEIRTPPLWGLRLRTPYLHDGRASNLHQAIEMHRGEAEAVRTAYLALSPQEREALLAFLQSL